MRRQLERVFTAGFQVRRAVQRDAIARLAACRSASTGLSMADLASVRETLGFTLAGLERAAYGHVDAAPHLRRYLTKALAMHLADEVWQGTARHLFPDASGRRSGRPRVGSWWQFRTIRGRARSHTTARKWETWRLAGTLAGHRAVFDRHGRFRQPRAMPAVTPCRDGAPVRSWWDHEGAFAAVLTGTGDRYLVLPVRLPQGSGRQPVVEHYLADPGRWHKVDVVRDRDPGRPGGWRYTAHLTIVGPGHTSPAVAGRREAAARVQRRAGIDVNVSNLAVASVAIGPSEPVGLLANHIAKTGPDLDRLAAERLRQRRRQRALERSRRTSNPTQYRLSLRQQRRADRRHAAGLPPVTVTTPGGPRVANAAGIPQQGYRRDSLSRGYRRLRARAVVDGAARTRAGHTRARHAAADIVAAHGADLMVEDVDLRTWARRWGRGIHAFTPGMLLHAIEREAAKVAALSGGPGLRRVGTRHTAWTQHCLCRTRVGKQLRHRRHTCPACGLTGDRDLVAALIGAHTVLAEPGVPGSARVDWDAAAHTLATFGVAAISHGLQGARTESTGHHRPPPATR